MYLLFTYLLIYLFDCLVGWGGAGMGWILCWAGLGWAAAWLGLALLGAWLGASLGAWLSWLGLV